MFRGKVRRIHFVGIGGSGMSGIAEVLLNMGFLVSGSDLKEGPVTRRLRGLGGTIHIGHDAQHVQGVDVVVRSTAVARQNPELQAAEAQKIPVIPRAEMLAELMRMKYGLAVAGTHGKTTTTSMLATCLHKAGLDPTIVIGGRLDSMGSSARLGAGDFMVAEADESDGSFLHLSPTVAVVTNIDPEHLDHWGTMDALVDGFADFANKVPFFGFAALCLDHPTVQALLPRLRRRVVTFGLNPQAEVRAVDVQLDGLDTRFRVVVRDAPLLDVQLSMPGEHNVKNALAAIAVCLELDIAPARIQEALQGFSGVDRRFSVRAEVVVDPADPRPVTIVDDYGHHPAEIRTTLEATRRAFPGRRVVAVVQPHRYTRVRDLFEDFARCLNDAGHVVLCPLYAAGEAPIEGIDHPHLAAAVVRHGHRSVVAVDGLEAAVAHLRDFVRPGDLVLTLGAGDVNRVCELLAQALREGAGRGPA
jgi:UDP-N-acetylmuramate--alanine ligase